MPPTRSTLKTLQFVTAEELRILTEAEAEVKLKRLAEIEAELHIESGIYFSFEKLMNRSDLKKLGKMIFSYLDFETLIQARLVSKTWHCFLDKERDLWLQISRRKLHSLKQSSWCDYNCSYIDKKYPKIEVAFRSNQNYIQWEMLSEAIELNGNVADFIAFIQRREDCFDRKNRYSDDIEMRLLESFYEFEHSPIAAAINYGKYYWTDIKFLKLLKKHEFAHGIELLAKRFVFWAVAKMKGIEALQCVLSILPTKDLYTQYDLEYGNSVFDPISYAISKQDLPKLNLLIPLATSLYWNSGSPDVDGLREGHSPLTDAILIGNFDILKMLIPFTDLNCNSNLAYGSYIHAAIKYGRFEMFQHLCFLLKDWKNMTNTENVTVYQTLIDENFSIEINDMQPGPICSGPKFAKNEVKDLFKQKAIQFIKDN